MHSEATIRVSDFPLSMTNTAARDTSLVVLLGNPNAGKTTLFNRLTGSKAKVGNYPGITVEQRSGPVDLPHGETVELIDLPGTYSLNAQSQDEQAAVDVVLPLEGIPPDLVVVVVDATALERNLYLALQLMGAGLPTVIALNMMDEAHQQGLSISTDKLSERLEVPVVPVTALTGEGLPNLLHHMESALHAPLSSAGRTTFQRSNRYQNTFSGLTELLQKRNPHLGAAALFARAKWCVQSLGDDELSGIAPEIRVAAKQARSSVADDDIDHVLVQELYDVAERCVADAVTRSPTPSKPSWGQRLDPILVHSFWGTLSFVVIMLVLFEALFTWSEPVMQLIEQAVAGAQLLAFQVLPAGPLTDLIAHGVIAGVGNVLIFVPQIAFLCAFLAFIEDSGYLARVAFLIDRLMRSVGLNGRAFVPLLSGYACAVPAIIATRTLENRRDRLITMLSLPFMACSARLPVFGLIIATIFTSSDRLLGILSVGTLLLASMYILSLVVTLLAAWVLRRTVLRGPRPTFILELPPFRRPNLRNISNVVGERLRIFLIDAGTVIVAFTIVLWGLLSFPRNDQLHLRYESERENARAAASEQGWPQERLRDELQRLQVEESSKQIRYSVAGRVGRFVEPAIKPLGYDWRIGIGLLGSFAAREVFVSTLGVVYGVADADAAPTPLRDALRREKREDGTPLFSPLTGISLMVFFLLACQCMSTVAVVRRESESWKWPIFMVTYMTAVAYLASLAVYQIGSAFT